MKKVWIINANPKNVDYKDKEKVNLYIKSDIEAGELVKLSYVEKDVLALIKDAVKGSILTEEQIIKIGELNMKELISSDKFLFVDELATEEFVKGNEELTKLEKDKNELSNGDDGYSINDEENWLDFGSSKDVVQKTEIKKETKKVVELTQKGMFLAALAPVIYFLTSFNDNFSLVLYTCVIYSTAFLSYKLFTRKMDLLSRGIQILFLSLYIFRLITPYWARSIAPLYVSAGFLLVLVLGLYLDDSVITKYFSNSKNTKEKCEKFDYLWILCGLVVLGLLMFAKSVSTFVILVLYLIPWVVTALNLRRVEYDMEVESNLEDEITTKIISESNLDEESSEGLECNTLEETADEVLSIDESEKDEDNKF